MSTLNPGGRTADDRLVDLELLVTHLQHDLDALNAALIGQHKQLADLRRLLERLDERLLRAEDTADPRSPREEKPPHY